MINSIEDNAFMGCLHRLFKGRKINLCKKYVLLCIIYLLQFIIVYNWSKHFINCILCVSPIIYFYKMCILKDKWKWVLNITPWALYPNRKGPSTHCTGGWVGSDASLDVFQEEIISCPYRDLKPGLPGP